MDTDRDQHPVKLPSAKGPVGHTDSGAGHAHRHPVGHTDSKAGHAHQHRMTIKNPRRIRNAVRIKNAGRHCCYLRVFFSTSSSVTP